MLLILRSDSINVIKWWVDALYAVHGDMRGHNVTIVSLDAGRKSACQRNKNQHEESYIFGEEEKSTRVTLDAILY